MALQLGFNGAVRLLNKDGIDDVLTLTLDRYRAFTEAITHDITEDIVYWRTVFAILSVHTAFEPTCAAYSMLRENGRMPRAWRTLTRWLAKVNESGKVVMFPGQKTRYLLEFDKRWREDASQFMPNGDESKGWRDRLIGIRGLARTKASFAVCLADPMQAQVICIDRHMARLLLGYIPRNSLPDKVYDRAEREILSLARGYKAHPFAVQWCLWDAVRGHPEPHDVLRVA